MASNETDSTNRIQFFMFVGELVPEGDLIQKGI